LRRCLKKAQNKNKQNCRFVRTTGGAFRSQDEPGVETLDGRRVERGHRHDHAFSWRSGL